MWFSFFDLKTIQRCHPAEVMDQREHVLLWERVWAQWRLQSKSAIAWCQKQRRFDKIQPIKLISHYVLKQLYQKTIFQNTKTTVVYFTCLAIYQRSRPHKWPHVTVNVRRICTNFNALHLLVHLFIHLLSLVYLINSLVNLIMLSAWTRNSINSINYIHFFPLKSMLKMSLQIRKKEKKAYADQNSDIYQILIHNTSFLCSDSWHSMQNVRRNAWRSMTWPGFCWWVWGASYQPWRKAYGKEACLHLKLVKQS